MMQRKKELENVTGTEKALAFEHLMKEKEQGKIGIKSALRCLDLHAGEDSSESKGEQQHDVGIETETNGKLCPPE